MVEEDNPLFVGEVEDSNTSDQRPEEGHMAELEGCNAQVLPNIHKMEQGMLVACKEVRAAESQCADTVAEVLDGMQGMVGQMKMVEEHSMVEEVPAGVQDIPKHASEQELNKVQMLALVRLEDAVS